MVKVGTGAGNCSVALVQLEHVLALEDSHAAHALVFKVTLETLCQLCWICHFGFECGSLTSVGLVRDELESDVVRLRVDRWRQVQAAISIDSWLGGVDAVIDFDIVKRAAGWPGLHVHVHWSQFDPKFRKCLNHIIAIGIIWIVASLETGCGEAADCTSSAQIELDIARAGDAVC